MVRASPFPETLHSQHQGTRDIATPMFSRLVFSVSVVLVLASFSFSGCASAAKGKGKKKHQEAERQEVAKKKAEPTMRDVSNDTSFQAFVGHLRTAVAKHDRAELSVLMAPDFGYRWDDPPAGETPFDFWDRNNLWGELESILSGRFLPSESYMVAPTQFVTDPAYRGYRAGIRLLNGSWRFAYFITGEDVLQ